MFIYIKCLYYKNPKEFHISCDKRKAHMYLSFIRFL